MLDISPFFGIRPHPKKAKEVISPPYDVMDREEARSLAENKPFSFLRITRSDLEFPDDVSPYADEVYQRAKKNFSDFLEKKVLIQDEEESYYIYRIRSENKEQTGLVALFSGKDYLHNKIKKHELTRPEKEKDRTRHIQVVGAHTGPVFLLYRHEKAEHLTQFLSNYANEHTAIYNIKIEDGTEHCFYRIASEEKHSIEANLSSLDFAYIADGHHRAASAVNASDLSSPSPSYGQGADGTDGTHGRFLAVAFPDNQLQILPYNRVLANRNGFLEKDLLEEISKRGFSIVKGRYGVLEDWQMNMYMGDTWYKISWKIERNEKIEKLTSSLAVAFLQKQIIEPIFGISDTRTSPNIAFIGGIHGEVGLEKLIRERKYKVAFSLPSIKTKDLLQVADADQVMPPKSTWFEPKLYSGFIVNRF